MNSNNYPYETFLLSYSLFPFAEKFKIFINTP